jgi:3-phenylpropionate/trans-cinnamate dioxygenase ferredoxin component
MAEWVETVPESELDEQIRVEVGERAFAVFRLDDGIYALDDVCSHEYSRLSEGELWDEEVYCPKHGSRFDIRSGAVRSFPAFKPVKSYPVKVENGKIYMDLERLG